VDVNTADGIVRAVKELHISQVIAGWGGNRTSSDRLFGSIMERLIDDCPSWLLFCRLVRPLNTVRRLTLLLPPLAERRDDLPQFLRDAKRLSQQIGAELRIYLTERDSAAMRKRVENTPPSRPLSFIASSALGAARAKLLRDLKPDDLVLLLGERPTSVFLTPALDRLASLVLSHCPGNNLLLAYPALAAYDEAELAETAGPESDALRICPVPVGPETTHLDALLAGMTARTFPSGSAAADEAQLLLRTAAKNYPVELAARVLLLHAHCETIARPILMVAFDCSHCAIPGLSESPRIVLALLNPTSSSPERHLRTLADIGRRFRDAETVERLTQARSADEVAALFT